MKQIVLIMLLCSQTFGATYYVDAATGSDSDNGTTWELAWETIPYPGESRGGSTFNAGDTAWYKNGDYGNFDRDVNVDHGEGTGQDDLEYNTVWTYHKAESGHTPDIDGIYILQRDKWGGAGQGTSYYSFTGFDVNVVSCSEFTGLEIDGCTITNQGWDEPNSVGGSFYPYYVSTTVSIVHNTGTSNNVTIENCTITGGARCCEVKAHDCNVWDNTITTFGEDGINIGGNNSFVKGNTISDANYYRGYITVANPTVDANGGSGWSQGEPIHQHSSGAEGWYVQQSGTNYRIVQDGSTNFVDGQTIVGETSGATFTDVDVDYFHQDGIQVETSNVTDINIVSNSINCTDNSGNILCQGIKFKGTTVDIDDVNIINNVIYNCNANGFLISGVTGMTVVNNVVMGDAGQSGQARFYDDFGDAVIDVMRNNVFKTLSLQDEPAGDPNVQVVAHSHNVFGNDPNGQGGNIKFVVDLATETTSADFTSGYFVDFANDDYSIDASSALYNTGTDTDAPLFDILGNTRPIGTTDKGAYELQAAIKYLFGWSN